MSKKELIGLTLGQVAIGSIAGLFSAWLCLFILENVLWKMLIGSRVLHGFWAGLLLLLSLGITYGLMIASASEGVRFVSRKFSVDIPFKPIFSGALLGPPAVVGLLALLNVPWEIFGTANVIIAILLPLLKAAAYIISLPMRGWVNLGLPVEIWYILAVPIGAILGYRLPAAATEVEINQT